MISPTPPPPPPPRPPASAAHHPAPVPPPTADKARPLPPPGTPLHPTRLDLYRNGYLTLHFRVAVDGPASLTLHVPRAHFALSVRTLALRDSRAPAAPAPPTPDISFPSPPPRAVHGASPANAFLARLVGTSVTLPLRDGPRALDDPVDARPRRAGAADDATAADPGEDDDDDADIDDEVDIDDIDDIDEGDDALARASADTHTGAEAHTRVHDAVATPASAHAHKHASGVVAPRASARPRPQRKRAVPKQKQEKRRAPTRGHLLAVDTSGRDATAYVRAEDGVVLHPVDADAPLAIDTPLPAHTVPLCAPHAAPDGLLPVTVRARGVGAGEVTLSYDTLSPLDPAYDIHYVVSAAESSQNETDAGDGATALRGRPVESDLRCVAHVANPLPFAVSGVRLVLRDSHYRREVRQALRYDGARGDSRSDNDARSLGSGSGSGSRSHSRSSSSSDDDDLPGHLRARGRGGGAAGVPGGVGGLGGGAGFGSDNDDVTLASASETDRAAFNYSPNFAHVVDAPVDLPARGALSVPLFDTRCTVRMLHGCGCDDTDLAVCLAIRNTCGRALESGTLHCTLGGGDDTLTTRKTMTLGGDESYYRTDAARTVSLRKTVVDRAAEPAVALGASGEFRVRRAVRRETRFDLHNRLRGAEEVVVAIKSRRYAEDAVLTDVRVFDLGPPGAETDAGFSQPDVLKPVAGKEYLSVMVPGRARRTLVVTQEFTHDEPVGLPWQLSREAWTRLLHSEAVAPDVRAQLERMATGIKELQAVKRKRALVARKQKELHKYLGRKADDQVSSEDEEYDDEAGADGMTGIVQRHVRISDTVEKGMLYVLEEIDKLNAELSSIRERIRDAREELRAIL